MCRLKVIQIAKELLTLLRPQSAKSLYQGLVLIPAEK
ncbi:hypothetical protein PSYPI_06645 [Pseudomonas syringae pv. pisi str. 1704B]|uniref:Uncharacterized protein n=1 Tax=Pseudomonas syringae pv. pisi str. 1704B TaxID=629263 RepID=F3G4U9_PSESJ|nr:hypothetical protein PSYPI_06645 [Pseudomonas syringae pv. pisi str. 1704B]